MRAAALASLAFAVLAPTMAHAELTLCNRTSYRMDVAIGLEKRANVETRGWFRVDPGQCRQIIDGPYDAEMTYLHTRTPPVYGSAPVPQDGNSDFCVRDGDFVIASARDCGMSQQVRFSAARPTDVPGRGPTVNLGEEADYDEAQARLAGIQRLLAIAGYDASPIDGVQGSKTQAALNRFLADRKLAADHPQSANFFETLINAAISPEGRGFSWCNESKNAVMAAIGTTEGGALITRGWYRVDAGTCLRPDVRGEQQKLYSYAEAVDSGGRTLKRGDLAVSWGGDVPLCTRDGKFELSDQKDCAARGLNSTGFVAVDTTTQASTVVRFKEP
jgi:uncharacterized membrane protein